MRNKAFVIILILLAAFSCSRPSSYEPFILREKAEYGDTYSYNLDLADSTVSYSLDFFTRLSKEPFQSSTVDSLILGIRWTSPSDSSYFEETVLRLNATVDSSYYNRDYIIPFREPLEMPERGIWRMRVRVKNNPEDIRGLGIILKRNGSR